MFMKIFRSNYIKTLSSERGLTLIEIIVSLAILSVVLVAFLNLFIDAGRDNLAVSYKGKAVYIAQSYMEKVYEGSTEHNYNDFHAILTASDDPEYNFNWDSVNEVYDKIDDDYHVRIKITSKKLDLYSVLIQIYNESQTELLAQNENAFIFKK